MKKGIKLTVDYAFKRLLGHDENKHILIMFINQMLGLFGDDKIKSVILKNPFSIKTFDKEKQNILDIKVEDNLGRSYDIEIQVIIHDYFTNRIVHYQSRMYSEQIGKGEDWDKLKPVISIIIMAETLFEGDDAYYNEFLFRNQHNTIILTKDMQFHTFELTKFNNKINELANEQEEWIYLIKHSHEIDFKKNTHHFKYIPIKEISEVMLKMVKSKTEMLQYEDRLRWERDQRALRQTGENKGYERGKEEGEKIGIEKGEKIGIEKGEKIGIEKGEKIGIEKGDKKARIETAKNLKKLGIDLDKIILATGLSEDDIENL